MAADHDIPVQALQQRKERPWSGHHLQLPSVAADRKRSGRPQEGGGLRGNKRMRIHQNKSLAESCFTAALLPPYHADPGSVSALVT